MLAAHVPAAQKKASRARLISDSSRAEFRKLRQIEIEKEQKLEEIEALQKLMDRVSITYNCRCCNPVVVTGNGH